MLKNLHKQQTKTVVTKNIFNIKLKTYKKLHFSFKGEQGTAELGAKTILKQINEQRFLRQKLPSHIVTVKMARIIGFGSTIVVNSWQR